MSRLVSSPFLESVYVHARIRRITFHQQYCILWLGFPPEQDTWKPRSSLRRVLTDAVRSYESIESTYSDVVADVNVLVANESESDDENVVVSVNHHENETSMISAQRDEHVNVVPSCAEYTPEIDSVAKIIDANETHNK